MIGNDIVDLNQARLESNWRRRGYIDKIFTPYEQQLIEEANNPDQMVWLLWSMKESAYKLAVRTTKERLFAPTKIACSLHESTAETVDGAVFYGETYQTRSIITTNYIATIAFPVNTVPTVTQVIVPFDTADSRAHQRLIRQQIRQHVSVAVNVSEQHICIENDSLGIPLVTAGNVALSLSISHHGQYGAFAIVPSKLQPEISDTLRVFSEYAV
ncbi:4'-phosphopantetheinyl transferase family protein [Spirosoma pollinicola]|uniref:4'-phosphopantetheinyl transferase domain-containing protein n=1 Tax=Spirosoma pollinicola TaxID=2057025 RepID=A0A2K8YV65_9BACT|nr:4'-phosphopantetheinyl transferase superfamily protein [Spirosoma pollinicola]AUD01511.1 hypothetical protein CWM47_06595 [Spirosoma pollinicola]